MWHGGMTVIGAIRNILLYSVSYLVLFSVGHAGMTLIGAIRNNLLYSVCDR
jgi:hypothetical protein